MCNANVQQKPRWWSRLKAKLLCFRPHGHPRRIADASPSRGPTGDTAAAAYMIHQETQQPVFAFVAPPSSPASSLLASEATSPAALLRLNASSTYSSPSAGPRSMFAIGPYAREPQQLVSPPVPSTFTTEPSTPPLTPPQQECASLRLPTNPSSPEVPFARFLASSSSAHDHAAEQQSGGEGFQAYCLHPGSPILVSPGSVCSTSGSSPPLFRVTEQPPVILGPEDIAARKLHRLRTRTEGSLLDGHIPASTSGGRWSCGDAVSLEASTGTGSEVGKSGEFVFGNSNADGGSAAASVASEWFAVEGGGRASMEAETQGEGGSTSTWPFYPMLSELRHSRAAD